ncbi:hypothetical protein AURDEDRAFT_168477 [Auricularia subglabra TFB-10046 SS5]|nr:hypothetical protein AURDEDRAFT_168477 [Auricularia subglabra TFB-10046 SS5]
MSDQSEALRLSLIFKLGRDWIIPVLYDTVILESLRSMRAFQRTAERGRGRAVRSLALDLPFCDHDSFEPLSALLVVLPRLRNLNIPVQLAPQLHKLIRSPARVYLSVPAAGTAWIEESDVRPTNIEAYGVTHLYIEVPEVQDFVSCASMLPTARLIFPRLTHLAFAFGYSVMHGTIPSVFCGLSAIIKTFPLLRRLCIRKIWDDYAKEHDDKRRWLLAAHRELKDLQPLHPRTTIDVDIIDGEYRCWAGAAMDRTVCGKSLWGADAHRMLDLWAPGQADLPKALLDSPEERLDGDS